MQINWPDDIQIYDPTLMLVRRYERPETTESGLYFPDSWKQDRSGTLFEAVKWGDDVEEELGYRLHEGAIVKTTTMAPTPAGDLQQRFFWLDVKNVRHIQLWKAHEETQTE